MCSPSQLLFWIWICPKDALVLQSASEPVSSSLKTFTSVNVLISFTSPIKSVIPLVYLVFKTDLSQP